MKKFLSAIALIAVLTLSGCGKTPTIPTSDDSSISDTSVIPTYTFEEPTYEWATNYSTCTARRVCIEDASLSEEEVSTSVHTHIDPGCENDGEDRYVASFTNSAFETQTKVEVLHAHGHLFLDPTYEWSDDNSTCTATRVCFYDASHKETETVNTIYSVVDAAQCTIDGLGRYSATFTNAAFSNQTKDVVIDRIGHSWGTPTYEWASNYSSCTATVVCENDTSHVVTETQNATYDVITAPTESSEGLGRYSVDFYNVLFEDQSQDVVLPPASPYEVTASEYNHLMFTKYAVNDMVNRNYSFSFYQSYTMGSTSSSSTIVSKADNGKLYNHQTITTNGTTTQVEVYVALTANSYNDSTKKLSFTQYYYNGENWASIARTNMDGIGTSLVPALDAFAFSELSFNNVTKRYEHLASKTTTVADGTVTYTNVKIGFNNKNLDYLSYNCVINGTSNMFVEISNFTDFGTTSVVLPTV